MAAADPPSPETKTCPYCAETIRAAAIKCRYCQSELDQPDPAPAALPPPAVPTATDAAAARSSRGDTADRRRWRRGGGRSRHLGLDRLWSGRARWLTLATAVVVVLLLVLAGNAWRERDELADAEQAGRVARAAAADKVETLLSYRHASFDEDMSAAQELLTESFREEYMPTVAEIRRRALKQRRDQQAEVLAVGLVSAEESRVRVLVFVNTLSARERSDEPPVVMQNRVIVDLVPESGGWLIDDVTFPTT